MRKELYAALVAALGEMDEIKHVDLWNRNVEFIEQETPWARPAVFVEFQPITWKPLVGDSVLRSENKLTLHIVTDWKGDCTTGWDLSAKLVKKLYGLSGEGFSKLRIEESETNHNHEDIVETVDTYSYKGTLTLG